MQLLCNALPPGLIDPYYFEDDQIENRLRSIYNVKEKTNDV